MANLTGYYIINSQNAVVSGPFPFASQAADLIDLQIDSLDFSTCSRNQLAQWGLYPRTKAGNTALEFALKTPYELAHGPIEKHQRFGFF